MGENLTDADIKKIEEEIKYRELELRPKLLEDLKEAKSQGDLSENFEYYVAKRENNKNNSRVRYLKKLIATANIIEDSSNADEVGINDRVTVYIEEDDEEASYSITTGVRSNSLKDIISIESPMGKALLGRKAGEKIEVRVNDNYSYFVEIRKIEKGAGVSGDITI